MKRLHLLVFLTVFFISAANMEAQKRRLPKKAVQPPTAARKSEFTNTAVVVDERLAVLRTEPSLFAKSVQRMRLGRIISISGSKEADGVTFFRVAASSPASNGWIQADAVFGKFRRGDDERLARLIQSSDGFEKIERTQVFLETFTASPLRPAILLLFGDLMEEAALKISSDATRRLDRSEMSASGAPLHSFYLNFVSLDRYRKLGIGFTFNSNTKLLHYDGASWRGIIAKFSTSAEAVEAQKRLDSLKEKLAKNLN